jgi:pimeloyl-ACP methyl ester carboxylesterase
LQRYLETHQLPGAVLLASLPSVGMFPMTLRNIRRHPLPSLKSIFTMNMYESVKTPELAREIFLNPKTEIDVVAFQKRLVGESFGAQRLMFPFTKVNAEKSPVLVIAAENDAFFTLGEERKTAEKYGAKFVIIKGQAHNLMMESAWKETADVVAGWLLELNFP